MKTQLSTLSPVCEYMVIIDLPSRVQEKLGTLRNELNAQLGIGPVNTRFRLTLASFSASCELEPSIAQALHPVAMTSYPFKIELKNFETYNNNHLRLAVTPALPLQQIVKGIKRALHPFLRGYTKYAPYFMTIPHLKLLNRLLPWQAEKIRNTVVNRRLTVKATVSQLLLVKKYEGDKS